MYPSQKDTTYGTFVKSFHDNITKEDSSFLFKKIVIKGRSHNKVNKLFKYIKFYLEILFYTLFYKYDIVYVHQITHATPALRIAYSIKKFKLVMNIHGEDLLTQTRLSAKQFKQTLPLLKESKLIVLPSEYFKDILINMQLPINISKLFVSPSSGIDSSIFQYYPSSTRSYKIAYVSRIDRGKGWSTVINSAYKIKQQSKLNIKFLFAGYGSQVDDLYKSIQKKGLEDTCKYIGPLTHHELNELYHNIDLMIFPTELNESLGLVGLEALACGCPVIGTKIGCLPEYIINNYNGYLFTPGNDIELSNLITGFYELPDKKISELQKNAYSIAQRYDSQITAQNMIKKLYSL